LIVGAPREAFHAGAEEYGAGFVFEGSGSNWSKVHRADPLAPPGSFDDQDFARYVANDAGERMAISADSRILILERSGGAWDEHDIVLSSRHVEGIDFDFSRLLYSDSLYDEVGVIIRGPKTWALRMPLTAPGMTTTPGDVAVSGRKAAAGYPYEGLAGPNTGVILTYQLPPLQPDGDLEFYEALAFGDAMPGDAFGVALDAVQIDNLNSLAVVGAPNDRRGDALAGAAYLYQYDAEQDRWTKTERWQPADLEGDASFAAAVAIDGFSRIAAGAPRNLLGGQMLGSVYVRHEGSGEVMLTPVDPQQLYGASLAYRDDTLVVGAPSGNGVQVESGTVYVYQYDDTIDNWYLNNRLAHSDSTSFAEFGGAVDLDGDWIVVGSPGDQRDGVNAGAAYVYYRGATWIIATRLDSGGVIAGDRFGASVAIAGKVAVVGAPGDDSAASDGGAVHVFENIAGVWTFLDTLTAADAQTGDNFGASVWLDGEDLFVGAPSVDANGADTGATYSFRRFGDTWVAPTERIIHNSPVADDRAGSAVAFVSDMLLAGAERRRDHRVRLQCAYRGAVAARPWARRGGLP